MITNQLFSSEIIYKNGIGNSVAFSIRAKDTHVELTCEEFAPQIRDDEEFIKTFVGDLNIRVMDTIMLARSMTLDREFDNGHVDPVQINLQEVEYALDGYVLSYSF